MNSETWKMNIGQCKMWFFDVCQGELTGKACEEPSDCGCQYRGIDPEY